MSIVTIIDRVTEWAAEEVCKPVKLKCPPDGWENDANNAGYEYKLISPACFPLYVPTKEKLPPKILSPVPSVAVRILEGEDALSENAGKVKLDMVFSAWDTGAHGRDVFLPVSGSAGTFRKLPDDEATAYFQRNTEGWRDVWNWVDTALRALESTTNVAGYEIDPKTPVKYGPITEQDDIPDFYPFWFAWISFALKYPLNRNIRQFEGLL